MREWVMHRVQANKTNLELIKLLRKHTVNIFKQHENEQLLHLIHLP
jgi:hypothetical protein